MGSQSREAFRKMENTQKGLPALSSEDGKLTPEKRKRRRSVRPHNLRVGEREDGICSRKQPRAHPRRKSALLSAPE